MDIACPQCLASYEIDEATLAPSGRKVRCAACGEVWRVVPDAAAADEPAKTFQGAPSVGVPELAASGTHTPDSTAPEATTPDGASPAQPKRRGRWIADPVQAGRPAAWRRLADWRAAASLAALAVVAGGLHQRERVVRLLPQAARIYAAVGLPVNLRGIDIRNVSGRVAQDGEDSVLVVDGDLVNVAGREVEVPRLHFALLGPDGRQIYVWSAQADRAALQPGEVLSFRRRLAAPPPEARDVSVRFLNRSDITAGIK